jgi:F0F1-type ATP synthase epsilon subunit
VTIVVEAAPPGNTAPIADAGPDQSGIFAGGTVALDGSGSSDADGDPLTYAWTLTAVPAGSAATLSDATAAAPTFTADVVGSYVAELVVNDGTVDSAPDTVTIAVEAPPPDNSAPIADAGPDQPGVPQNATVTLDGSASSDPDGDSLTYAWTLTSVPTGSAAALSDATAVRPTFIADSAGTYVAELVVNDGAADSAPDTVTITVDSGAPTADAGPDQADVSQGATVTLDGSASSDPDGDPLTYAWTLITVPDGSTAVLSDATVVGPTFVADLAGSYVAELVVSDGTFDSAPDRVTITVDSEAPTADAGPDQSGVSQGATVALDGSGSSDPTGDPLTYAWTLTSIPVGSAAVLSDATAVGPTFVVDLAGSYVAELVVNDGTFDSEPDTVTVTVDDTAPFAPAGLTASGEDGEVILNWDDNAELDLAAAPYNVRRSETQGGPYTDVSGPLSASTFTDATVVNETTYYYVVTAEDAASNVSPDSAEVAAMPNGPVHAYWEMDEGAGATTADTEVLGGTSDGTLADPTTWTTGVAGNGIDFNGTSDFVEIANTPELQITGTEITLMAWIYPPP